MNGRKIRYTVAALGLGMLLAGGQAAAVPFFSPTTSFEDDDVDFHVDNNGNGVIDEGERLKGVFEINTVFGSQAGQGPVDLEADTGEELTGVFDITVASKTDVGGGNFNFQFEPSGAGGILGGGTMVRLWTDDGPDLDLFGDTNCASQLDCEQRAGLGGALGSVLFMDLGFAGDADEIWAASNVPDSTATVLAGDPGTIFGGFNHALSILVNNTGESFGQIACTPGTCSGAGDGLVDWIGSGTINGGNNLGAGIVADGAFATSDFQGSLALAEAVPEPGSLVLLAVGLIGLGVTFRMRCRNV